MGAGSWSRRRTTAVYLQSSSALLRRRSLAPARVWRDCLVESCSCDRDYRVGQLHVSICRLSIRTTGRLVGNGIVSVCALFPCGHFCAPRIFRVDGFSVLPANVVWIQPL